MHLMLSHHRISGKSCFRDTAFIPIRAQLPARRGHAFMLDDQRSTKRVTERPQTGACLHCHAANTLAYRQEGLKAGTPGTLEAPLLSSEG
ncbi:MAG TPA: hypothetical protein VIL39_08450 [Verrucomicrobiae bacterium]